MASPPVLELAVFSGNALSLKHLLLKIEFHSTFNTMVVIVGTCSS